MNHFVYLLSRAVLAAALLSACATETGLDAAKARFSATLVASHGFDPANVQAVLAKAAIKPDILHKIAQPAEALPWYRYRKLFLTDARIAGGVKYWQAHAEVLAETEHRYGVPPQVVVAILGVETAYGQHTGSYRVLDALATLAFAYPPRHTFFLSELEQFFLLCREEQIAPEQVLGSYAGAMGKPQFMPSSYRRYAVDFNGDNHRDIWRDDADAIASIGQYFAQFHWQTGQAIAAPIRASGSDYKAFLKGGLKPDLRLDGLESLQLKLDRPLPLADKVKLLELNQEHDVELWAVTNNFYVITRYNHSPLYAMAVYQLSEAILQKKGDFP